MRPAALEYTGCATSVFGCVRSSCGIPVRPDVCGAGGDQGWQGGFVGELVERVDEHDRVVGVVDRGTAIRMRWLHRVATVVCRDRANRILVHRRPDSDELFPSHYNWLIGGAVAVGESYQQAARRELAEELRIAGRPRFLFKFLCHGAIAPYWLGVHEVVIDQAVVPDPSEISWCHWVPDTQLREVIRRWRFVPDSVDAFDRYPTVPRSGPPELG